MPPAEPHTDYERSDASPGLLAALAGGLLAIVVTVAVALRVFHPQSAEDTGESGPRKPLAPEPRLQVEPSADLASLRRAETERLASYGWVDPGGGRVRIPIDEAVPLLVRRGLPGWPKPSP